MELDFDGWARTAGPGLHRLGFVLTGDWASGQDLVQVSLVKTWKKWDTVEVPDAYVRGVMARTASTWRRRKWHGEVPTADLHDADERAHDPWGELHQRDALLAALGQLNARQRAVVVLRFYADLSEADTALALGVAVGTVKSATSRALATLRSLGIETERVG